MKNNIYKQADFILSANHPAQFPTDYGREVAFAGRSNTGKSSVINAVTGTRALARVSKIPGRTQMINFFSVTPGVRLVDLPGYGYAAVPDSLQQHWAGLTKAYINGRTSLQGLIMVTDIRRQMTEYDEQMLVWSLERQIPVHILLNKCDKLTKSEAKQALSTVTNAIEQQAASVQLFSALKKTGIAQVQAQLDEWLIKKRKAPDC